MQPAGWIYFPNKRLFKTPLVSPLSTMTYWPMDDASSMDYLLLITCLEDIRERIPISLLSWPKERQSPTCQQNMPSVIAMQLVLSFFFYRTCDYWFLIKRSLFNCYSHSHLSILKKGIGQLFNLMINLFSKYSSRIMYGPGYRKKNYTWLKVVINSLPRTIMNHHLPTVYDYSSFLIKLSPLNLIPSYIYGFHGTR